MANRKEKTQLSKLKDKSQTGKKNTFYHDLDNRSLYCKKKKKTLTNIGKLIEI